MARASFSRFREGLSPTVPCNCFCGGPVKGRLEAKFGALPRASVSHSLVHACSGFGPQKLATLAAYALRRNLLIWLETYKVEKLCAERMRLQRSTAAQVRHCRPDVACQGCWCSDALSG